MQYDRQVRVVMMLVVAAGCDAVFDLEHIPDAPPCTAVGHDEDGDGIDDACDACPFSFENDNDEDEDGLALACDPDPQTPNTILTFTGFEPRTRGEFSTVDGSFAADAFQVTGVGSSHMAWTQPLPEAGIWIIAGVNVTKLENSGFREIGFVFDATPVPMSTQYNGTMAVLGFTDHDYLQVLTRARPANDVAIATND